MTTTDQHDSGRIDVVANRYDVEGGATLLTGVQAVARLLVEIHARDAEHGRRTATMVSGYPGSPLGGLDRVVAGVADPDAHGIHLVPGLNEELAMTTVWGSQIHPSGQERTVDGVVGVWYGKAPGLDRCGDVLRHGNLLGAHPTGGALLMVGDDPACKSSTIPSASESTLAAQSVPVFYPRNSAEIVTMGLQAVELSRASGCFVALKIVTDVADGFSSVAGGSHGAEIAVPEASWDGRPWTYQQRTMVVPPGNIEAEAELAGPRLDLARAFALANGVNEVTGATPGDRIGIIAPGHSYDELLDALRTLGVDPQATPGLRLLRVGMPFPLEPSVVTEFADGLEEILVVEEKQPLVENQVRQILYGGPHQPRVLGKAGADGRTLVPAQGDLPAAVLLAPLRRALDGYLTLTPAPPQRRTLSLTPVGRTPFFCSGCPHNRSTVAVPGSIVGGGIGCHSMVALIDRPSSNAESITQMGGEGTQFIGQAPFLAGRSHLIQNLGDGTLFHSGQLAIQACIAADVNVTFKILFNHVVAMTGGQDAEGARDVPALTRKLEAEGVRRTIVVAREPKGYGRRARWAGNVEVWGRDRFEEAQLALQATDGVTVLIYDQECAAELRRLRKRGQRETPTTRLVINHRVCEGCGDCGVKSNCLSLQPVDTEFGRKTAIDQTSCNLDYSCLEGDCPSFVKVEAGSADRREASDPPAVADPALPQIGDTGSYDLFLAGIGGTGIVTVNQVLATAAMSEGLLPRGVDQTGLSQKAGPVTSHLRLRRDTEDVANRVDASGVDSYLAFDLLVGADPRFVGHIDPAKTLIVGSRSVVPTGAMVRQPELGSQVDGGQLAAAVERLGGDERAVWVDAMAASHELFGEETFANMLLVGAAFQAGAVPVSAGAIEWAIGVNGVAVDRNLAAFRWGRAAVADRAAFDAATRGARASAEPSTAERQAVERARGLVDQAGLPEPVRALAVRMAGELVRYQSVDLARRYLALVKRVAEAEGAMTDGFALTDAVARSYYKLLAYKDEYEVARLLTLPEARASLGHQVPGAHRARFMLHPPVLRSLGYNRKIQVDARLGWGLRGLARLRRLRGTPFDLFGYAHVRRVERALAAHYPVLVDALLADLSPATHARAVQAAAAADVVRGYEHVKLRNVTTYVEQLRELGLPTPDVDPEEA